ncbi:hypothetical protein ALFP_2503 [Alcaligenes faecalis]|nr:hypothetical protein ALFP_2503 [Alcaligenes faecalis]
MWRHDQGLSKDLVGSSTTLMPIFAEISSN